MSILKFLIINGHIPKNPMFKFIYSKLENVISLNNLDLNNGISK